MIQGAQDWCTGMTQRDEMYPKTPGGSDDKASVCNARDLGLTPGSGRLSGEGNGNPLQ